MRRWKWTAFALGIGLLAWRWSRILELLTRGSPLDRLAASVALALPLFAAGALAMPLEIRNRWVVRVAPRLVGGRAMTLGLVLSGVVCAAAVLAPVLITRDPVAIDLAHRLAPPSWAHPLGTDLAGRDQLSRVLHGLRTSLAIALPAVFIAIVIGTAMGTTAAFLRRLDGVLMRVVDVGMAFPRVFLLLVLFAFWRTISIGAMTLILGLTGWFHVTRLVRAEALAMRDTEFMLAARALGLPAWRKFTRHVLPNLAAPIIVTATLGIGNVILIESGLAYLGVGVSAPTPSLGRMINVGQTYLFTEPALAVVPGVTILVTVIAFSLLGDGLHHALNPRSR